jgi:type III secretion protein C
MHPQKVHLWKSGKRRVLAASLVACLGIATAGPVPWTEASYSYFAENIKLETLLAEFARSFSMSLSMAPELSGVVNGRFTSDSPTEFITKLAGVYGFVWYTHAGTLFISPSNDLATKSIALNSSNIQNMRKALTDLGVLDSRFGWGELPDQGLALVSGPTSYVNMIDSMVRSLPTPAAPKVKVFRLKHASADDRTILYRDKQITTPGLVTVLRELITKQGSGVAANEVLTITAEPLRAASSITSDQRGSTPSAATGTAGTMGAKRPNNAVGSLNADTGQARGTIQSDPRLNAIIIQDLPERMTIYEKLIAELDVPTALIEIEAMIIDINTDRATELGINWAGRTGSTALGFGALSATPSPGTLTIASAAANAAISTSTLLVDSGNYLINQIRALETKGEARIQSRPSVLTTDNTGAVLDLSETFYVRVQGQFVATVTPVTAGTTLRVTPRVISAENGNKLVQLTVDIEDGQIQSRQVDTLPTVSRSSVSTQAIVKQNETLLIAGYSTDQDIVSDQKVPFLGDLPGLGILFSSKGRTTQKRDRLFLIRPKIINTPEQFASSSSDISLVANQSQRLADTPHPVASVSTPPKAASVSDRFIFPVDDLFELEKAVLLADGEVKLANFTTKFKVALQDSDMLIAALSYTDSRGPKDHNIGLALARARAVKNYLVSRGLNADLIKTEGRSELSSAAGNSSPEEQVNNRNVKSSVLTIQLAQGLTAWEEGARVSTPDGVETNAR